MILGCFSMYISPNSDQLTIEEFFMPSMPYTEIPKRRMPTVGVDFLYIARYNISIICDKIDMIGELCGQKNDSVCF